MKNKRLMNLRKAFVLGLVLTMTLGCERELTDAAVPASFSKVGEVFTDDFIGMGTDFYKPFAGSKFEAFSVDDQEGYESAASYRVDVPNADDPNGNYAGAILRIDGAGRDLTDFDALTFWAKASQGVSVGEIGFGQDFFENKYLVTARDFSISTAWTKYVIPIPDASKLTEELGVFWYSMGTQGTGGAGYTVWFDEIKFEKLDNIAQPRPAIVDGEDIVTDTFTGVAAQLTGLTQTFNLGSGFDRTVEAAPSYFEFTSSNPDVAPVSESGLINVNGAGMSVITASLAGVDAAGSLTVNSLGDFQLPEPPTRNPSDVIAIYSDAYQAVPVDFFNGFWQPFQTTLSADFVVNGDNILNYTDFNFVGNQFANPTVDATDHGNLHVNMYIPGEVPANFDFLISVVNFGADQVDGGGDDTRQQLFINSSQVVANQWMTFEFPLTGLADRSSLGLIIYENINFATLRNFYLDNIYFYRDPVVVVGPTTAPDAPTEDEVTNSVISVFSDAYTDVANDGLNNFDSGSILSVDTFASNEVLSYSNLDFTGLEFLGPNIIDASATTTLHLDVWSPDANELKIKLVDFGADGSFGGGDDTEHEVNLGVTATDQWISYDLNLSDFTGLLNRDNLAQIILVNAPAGTLFVDNIYFYN
ncbi:MAG: glycosyl hydrolase family 16 [Winogradskyella sp.]|uniref:glycosyl hydrolase family 16 n=1 Tax=Winogradskyella sp. TaxID=1883156 RepID=UPI00385DC5D3